jgi:uncharacterized protein (DUF2141 family)
MNAEFTIEVNRIRREQGTAAAKAWAKSKGYAVRWDREGSIFIRDLLA